MSVQPAKKHVFKTTEGLYFTATLQGGNTWKSEIIILPTGEKIDPISFNYTANEVDVNLGDKLGKIKKDDLRGGWTSSSGGTRRRNAKRVKKSRSHRRNRKSKSKK